MNKKRWTILFICSALLIILWFFRNHIRLFVFKNFPVAKSSVVKYSNADEGLFTVDIYTCQRTYTGKIPTFVNKAFSDKLMVISWPLTGIKLNNLVLAPIGIDIISEKQLFYFNTLFFMSDYSPTTGLISEKVKISKKNPSKTRFGINDKGELTIFKNGNNKVYEDVLQAQFTFKQNSKGSKNFRTLNYRQFVTIKNNSLIYISGYNNSLISWTDVKELFLILGVNYVIALDGGASLDYCFKGKKINYQFSSIPLRNFYGKYNSPYYLEGR